MGILGSCNTETKMLMLMQLNSLHTKETKHRSIFFYHGHSVAQERYEVYPYNVYGSFELSIFT